MYIDDCVQGTQMIADGPRIEPINLGSSELVTINELVDIVEDIAGVKLERSYKLDAPQGVRGPQQRQHADPARPTAGSRRSRCATASRRPTRGSHEQVERSLSSAPR